MSVPPPELFRRWVHSYEEDTDAVRVYRPQGYPLPPARGRRQIEVGENGEFVEYGIAQTDKPLPRRGSWTAGGPSRVVVSFEDEREGSRVLDIAAVSDDRLELRL